MMYEDREDHCEQCGEELIGARELDRGLCEVCEDVAYEMLYWEQRIEAAREAEHFGIDHG